MRHKAVSSGLRSKGKVGTLDCEGDWRQWGAEGGAPQDGRDLIEFSLLTRRIYDVTRSSRYFYWEG